MKELKESEDEKIRKDIISFIKEGKPYYCPNSARRQKWVAWLKKQGEQKPLIIDEGKAEMDYCFTKMMNDEKINPAWSNIDEADLNKDIDLEKEIELIKGDYEQVDVAWNNDFDYIARYFFELGLNAQKKELNN